MLETPAPRPTRPAPARRPFAALALAVALATAPAAFPAALLTTATAVVATAPAARAVPADRVDLVDTAGVIDPAALQRGLDDVDFREPTRVAVYTERGADMSGLSDDAAAQEFNGRVLAHAREDHPEWLSADGQKWADGLMVFALDPANRIMGVYYGEDRRLDTDEQAAVREDATDAARDARWTDTAVDAIDSSATRIGRPWHENPALWAGLGATGIGLGAAGTAVACAVMVPPRRRRKKALADLAAARTHLASVTLEMEATEVNASTVPTADPRGALLLERFRGFRERSLDATRELQRLDAVPEEEQRSEGFAAASAELRASTEALDGLDDAIGAANTLLNRHPGWQDAWDLQMAPLREDLDAVDELDLKDADDDEVAAALSALTSFRVEAARRLESLGAELETERLTPSAALDDVDALRRALTDRLDRLAEAVITAAGKDRTERRLMRADLESSRGTRRRAPGSILDSVDGGSGYWSVPSFDAGYEAGSKSITSSRHTDSSSGTGYGSSGGSFSGSGSSGRF